MTAETNDNDSLYAEEDFADDNDTSNHLGHMPDNTLYHFQNIFLPCMYSLIFFFGLVGNLLVLIIFIFYEKLKSPTDVFLVNLATADILFLCTLPFLAYSALYGWVFGGFMCKIIMGAYNLNLNTSMLTLMCITVERFMSIARATKAHAWQEKMRIWCRVICLAVWAISILFSIPQFIFYHHFPESQKCEADYEPPFIKLIVRGFQLSAGFFMPLLAMAICYSVIIKILVNARGFKNHKSLKIIIVIVAVFIATQLPYNIVLLMSTVRGEFHFNRHFHTAIIITETVAYTHACLNPVLYFFIGAKFRKNFGKLVKNAGCAKHQREVSSQLRSTEEPSKTNSATTNLNATSMIRL
ncbi:C-X-C chemokine receptor type 6 [Ambystoma mexicanum]|uniref:C-X-C chemokine receptor type 6 n=1 Tax=Ambystoma mexicanum TaxID=8296 RepID=UPI0037E8610D